VNSIASVSQQRRHSPDTPYRKDFSPMSSPPTVVHVSGKALPHGTFDPKDVAGLSGMELFTAMAEGRLPPPPIGKTLNFWLSEFEHGRAVFEGEPTRDFYNPIGSVHGSYAAALLDSCMGCAVHTALPAGLGYTTLEYKISLVRGMSDQTGRIRAEGKVLQVGRRVATAEGRLTDAAGRLLAHGTTTCLVFETGASKA
jgi:uncharacterized protein (TIGR00369 family)